jgi:hypothetical protein
MTTEILMNLYPEEEDYLIRIVLSVVLVFHPLGAFPEEMIRMRSDRASLSRS